MGKLITETDVRRLVRDKKMKKGQVFLLPRGTILTPSARGFLLDRQVKIKAVAKNFSGEGKISNKIPLFTTNLDPLDVDFGDLDKLNAPILQLKSRLREQTIYLIRVIDFCSNDRNASSVVKAIIKLVNGILEGNFYTYEANSNIQKLDLSRLKFTSFNDEIFCLLSEIQNEIIDIALSLKMIKNFYPDVCDLDSFKDIVSWQKIIRKWTSNILSDGKIKT